jgi:hypothetical protein
MIASLHVWLARISKVQKRWGGDEHPVYQERKNMRYVSVLEKLRSNGLSRHYGDHDSQHFYVSCVHAPRV